MDDEGPIPDDLHVKLEWPGRERRDDDLDAPSTDRWESEPMGDDVSTMEPVVASAPRPDLLAGSLDLLPAPVARGGDDLAAAGLARVAEESAAARARLDTLTDAVITMRSFVGDRVGALGDIVARSEAQIAREISLAAELLPVAPDAMEVEVIVERSRAALAKQLREAMASAQANLTEELDRALAVTREHLTDHVERTVAAAQLHTLRQDDELHEEVEHSRAVIADLIGQARSTSTDVEQLGHALSQELGVVAVSLVEGIGRSADSLRGETRAGNERALEDLRSLGDSAAGALDQVADRLEHLARRTSEQDDVVDAVVDALDNLSTRVEQLDRSGTARHEQLIALLAHRVEEQASATTESLRVVADTVERLAMAQAEDLEQILDAVEARSDPPVVGADPGVAAQLAIIGEQLEALRRRIAVRARAPELSDAALTELAERVAARINSGDGTGPPG